MLCITSAHCSGRASTPPSSPLTLLVGHRRRTHGVSWPQCYLRRAKCRLPSSPTSTNGATAWMLMFQLFQFVPQVPGLPIFHSIQQPAIVKPRSNRARLGLILAPGFEVTCDTTYRTAALCVASEHRGSLFNLGYESAFSAEKTQKTMGEGRRSFLIVCSRGGRSHRR